MTKIKTPLSLSQHFDAPPNYVGEFGWVVGYSADAAFLNDAAERFTRKTDGQRAWEGFSRLAVMLDPGSPQITPVDVPGVAHLPLRADNKPFRLLHAKVAMLGFRHEKKHDEWHLRLIVSTGNWTRQTLEESLDLCWVVDIDSGQIGSGDKPLICADVKAGWSLINFVREFYDLRALGSKAGTFEQWINKLPSTAVLPAPRFFDNRGQSLLSQLPKLIETHAASVARNHISMGAGFYEAPLSDDVPAVLDQISMDLTRAGLLTANPEVAIFVNPLACQAVARSAKSIKKRRWDIKPAGNPGFFPEAPLRTLHAKFLFSANFRNSSNNCTSAWVYLGSGNLTGPGFLKSASTHGGNLEAGVIFSPEGLVWYQGKTDDPAKVISNVLPVQWDQNVDEVETLLLGGEMPDREEEFVAPPVAWLDWKGEQSGTDGWLTTPDVETAVNFDVIHGETICEFHANWIRWPSAQPRQVEIRWLDEGKQRRAIIPVRDEHGRFASAKLPALGHSDAWLQLESFPMSPEDEELRDENSPITLTDGIAHSPSAGGQFVAHYAIRDMMALIEKIAQKQTDIGDADWTAWLVRLEQTLLQMSDCAVLREFKGLTINPLSPLRNREFRPPFAEDNLTAAGSAYERALGRIEVKWGVTSMRKLETN
jgi:hypothetical protein